MTTNKIADAATGQDQVQVTEADQQWAAEALREGSYADVVAVFGRILAEHAATCVAFARHRLAHSPPEADAREALLVEEIARLKAENDRLSRAVCGGVLGDLLNDDETDALTDFIKSLRRQK